MLASVEGVKPKGKVEVRRVMVGNEILMLHVLREKGLIDPAVVDDLVDLASRSPSAPCAKWRKKRGSRSP